MAASYDAVVIGSGPNGLAAAVAIAQRGHSVLVVEAAATVGGATRTVELTLPGFHHDHCSAVHPTGVLSPYLSTLPLAAHGLEWVHPPASVAHPLDDGRCAMLELSVAETVRALGDEAWSRLVTPFLGDPASLFTDILAPQLKMPKRPFTMARFGLLGLRSAIGVARARLHSDAARALFAGCAAHSILSLDAAGTAAVALVFAISGHVKTWPVARGGSHAITRSLASLLTSPELGGVIECNRKVTTLAELPPSRVVLFDTSPAQLASIAGEALPAGYRGKLERYRYGPGVFKLDWALSAPIPWKARACLRASTVHVGGTLEEIAASEHAMWNGAPPEQPFLIVCQQSAFDDTRAPAGKHTGYAYCHVPSGCTVDMTERIEAQMERFAPGFRDVVLARHATSPAALLADNPNCVGGAITGGAADLAQLFARPVLRVNPYTTPNPRLFICSASSPPGGGVHGMCGYFAAQAALQRFHGATSRDP